MMKVVIIEDENFAAERLEKSLKEIASDIEIVAKLTSIQESVKWLITNTADLIFLDIQLSDGLSFSIFEQINVNTPVIFTTAYDKYAIKAFELNSISYLLKPIRKTELAESLQKYHSLKSAFNIDFSQLLSRLQNAPTEQPQYRKRFLIQVGEKFKKIEVSDIAFFYADKGYVFIKTFETKAYPVEMSLDKIESSINPAEFFRINRKYIVNINAISGMHAWSRSRVKLTLKPSSPNDMDTVVSVERTKNFKAWLNK